MKISFNCNNGAFQSPGGGEVLLLKTKEFLTKDKVNVKFFDSWNDKLENYDIFHNFGLSSNCYDLINSAYSKKVPIVVTPIYSWPSLRFALKSGSNLKERFNLTSYAIINNNYLFNKFTVVKKILDKANKILPDSQVEADLLIKRYKLSKNKFHPVPCGVDERFYEAKDKEFVKKYGLKDFVLYVGRIDSRKNVLVLIKIMNKLNLPLVIIGNSLPHQIGYYNMCRRIAKKNVYFLGKINHESSLLESAYAAAKVVVLPSFLETPGLSALEGGLAGSNVVVTTRGSSISYFKGYANYINPYNEEDIKRKILIAYHTEKDKELKNYIKSNFLWKIVVKKVKDVYNETLK